MIAPALAAAYLATDYCVDCPGGARVVLRLGQRSASFEDALKVAGVRDWCLIAAANPKSSPLPDGENEARFEQLLKAVSQAGWPCWRGVNLAPSDAWPPEATLCVLGISRHDSLCLAERFGQNAVVLPDELGIPALVWIQFISNT